MNVDIITRTRNRPLLLRRAIASVLSQRHRCWRHIIVNDGGDQAQVESVVAVAEAAYAGRLTLIHRSGGAGMEAASNAGIAAGSGEAIAIHDDDDTWEPDFLSETTAYMARNRSVGRLGGVVVHTWQIVEQVNGERIQELRRCVVNRWLDRITLAEASGPYPWLPISFLFLREAYQDVGPFREDLPVLGDREFNFRFLMRRDIGLIRRPLAHHRLRPNAAGADANSIAGEECFALHGAVLMNALVRADLEAGRLGLGSLLLLLETAKRAEVQSGVIPRILGRLQRLPGAGRVIGWLRGGA